MGMGLTCSAAMALPISGFPNMHATAVEDPKSGLRFLSTKDFLKIGVVSSLLAWMVLISVGFGLMSMVL